MTPLLSTTQTAANAWPIIATVASLFASGLFGLVLYNLSTLKAGFKASTDAIIKRQDAQALDIQKLIERKNICNQDYVGKVEYIRSTNALETDMKALVKAVAEMTGTLKVIEQMPRICGQIARDIVKEMKDNG